LSDRVVFGVEFIKTMKRVSILTMKKRCNSKRLGIMIFELFFYL